MSGAIGRPLTPGKHGGAHREATSYVKIFVLIGVEEIDGCLYAQSWWCREV